MSIGRCIHGIALVHDIHGLRVSQILRHIFDVGAGHHIDAARHIFHRGIHPQPRQFGKPQLRLIQRKVSRSDGQHMGALAHRLFDKQNSEFADILLVGIARSRLHQLQNLCGVPLVVDVEHLSVEGLQGFLFLAVIVGKLCTPGCPHGQLALQFFLLFLVGLSQYTLAQVHHFLVVSCGKKLVDGRWNDL